MSMSASALEISCSQDDSTHIVKPPAQGYDCCLNHTGKLNGQQNLNYESRDCSERICCTCKDHVRQSNATRSNCMFCVQANSLKQTKLKPSRCCCRLYRCAEISPQNRSCEFPLVCAATTPFYAYPPTRRKSSWISVLNLNSLFTFAYYSILLKSNFTNWLRTTFLMVLIFTFPLHTMAVKKDSLKCPSFKANCSSSVFYSNNQTTAKESSGTTSSPTCPHCDHVCQQLINCAKQGTCVYNSNENQVTSDRTLQNRSPNIKIVSSDSYTNDRLRNSAKCGTYKLTSLGLDLFCDDLPLFSLLSMELNVGSTSTMPYPNCTSSSSIENCEHSKCLNELNRIKEQDQFAKRNYLVFAATMEKYATPDNYSIWPSFKTQCLVGYKSWICSQNHQVHRLDHNCRKKRIWPCKSLCLNVEASCPVFRIFSFTKLRGGQPAFICHGFDLQNETMANDICYDAPNFVSTAPAIGSGIFTQNMPTSYPTQKGISPLTTIRVRHTSHKTIHIHGNATQAGNDAAATPYSLFYITCFVSMLVIFLTLESC
ncbi:uncharacterized protein LOC100186046 [Ciona intestinalis]